MEGVTPSGVRSAKMKDTTSLSSLLEKAQRLQSKQSSATAALPQVQLSLDQIESQSRRSAARVQQSQLGQESQAVEEAQAQYILGQAAVDTTALAQTLNRLDPMATFAPLQPMQDNDIEGLIRYANEVNIITAINEGRHNIVRDFYRDLERKSRKEWDQQRSEIFEELGAHSAGKGFGASVLGQPSLDGRNRGEIASGSMSIDGQNPLAAHPRMMMYDQVVLRLNDYRKRGQSLALASAFGDANQSMLSDARSARVAKMWRLLTFLIHEDNVVAGDFSGEPIPERKYARAYLTSNLDDPEAVDLREQLRNGALHFLEDLFLRDVNRELSENPADAQLGGDPSVENKIRAFVQLRFGKQNRWKGLGVHVADSTPIWARLFYLLRAGQADSAKKFAKSHVQHFDREDNDFVSYFVEWLEAPGRRLSPERHRNFLKHYDRIRNPSATGAIPDPFRVAIYKLISRADLMRRKLPGAADTVEDWLWVQLSLVREKAAHVDPTHEQYRLRDLAKVLTSYGEAHFGALYFDVLLLSGQFERAIAHLYSRNQHQVDAVHYAITFAYYGLLRVPARAQASDRDILTPTGGDNTKDHVAYLNFARIIYRYQRIFDRSAPEYALQYLCLIPLGVKGASPELEAEQVALCQNYIKELVINTKAYSVLLGDVTAQGQRHRGAVEQNGVLIQPVQPEIFANQLIKEVAQRADVEKRFEDAILLYNLADEPAAVLRVINGELGASLTRPAPAQVSGEHRPPTDTNIVALAVRDIAQTAETVLEWYDRDGRAGTDPNGPAATCRILVQLKKAMTLYEQGHLEPALMTIANTQLIPLGGDVNVIMRATERFNTLDDSIARHFGAVLLMTMQVLYRLYNQLKESPYGDVARQSKMVEYRDQARSLMMFAGMLRFRLTSDIYEQLTRLDVYLH